MCALVGRAVRDHEESDEVTTHMPNYFRTRDETADQLEKGLNEIDDNLDPWVVGLSPCRNARAYQDDDLGERFSGHMPIAPFRLNR